MSLATVEASKRLRGSRLEVAYRCASIGRTLTRSRFQVFRARLRQLTQSGCSQRATWINIAKEMKNTAVWVLVFDTPYEVSTIPLDLAYLSSLTVPFVEGVRG